MGSPPTADTIVLDDGNGVQSMSLETLGKRTVKEYLER